MLCTKLYSWSCKLLWAKLKWYYNRRLNDGATRTLNSSIAAMAWYELAVYVLTLRVPFKLFSPPDDMGGAVPLLCFCPMRGRKKNEAKNNFE